MNQSVKDRLLMFIAHIGMPKSKFVREVGVSSAYLVKLRHKPSDMVLDRIFNRFPELNKTWLLSGDGNMMITSAKKDDTTLISSLRNEITFLREQIRIKDDTISTLLTKLSKA